MMELILALDKSLFQILNSQLTAEWADLFFPFITDLHKSAYFKVVFLPLLICLFIWRRGLKRGVLIFVFCVLGIGISDGTATWVFKKNFQRLRPPMTEGLVVQVKAPSGGYSFVSNHATNVFMMATFLASVFPITSVGLYSFAFLVAYSRVYCGVHFPLDVICGAGLGIFIGLGISWLFKASTNRLQPLDVVK